MRLLFCLNGKEKKVVLLSFPPLQNHDIVLSTLHQILNGAVAHQSDDGAKGDGMLGSTPDTNNGIPTHVPL